MAKDPLRPTKTLSDIDTKSGATADVTGDGNISRTVKAEPTREYIAAVGALWYGPYVRALPQWIDDIGRDLGGDIYERMLYDPQVSKCLNDLRVGILENGYELQPIAAKDDSPAPRIGKRPQTIEPLSQEINDFCSRVLENLDRPFEDILFEMLGALAYGNKIGELVYEVAKDGPLAGKLILRDIRPKHRDNYAFVVDNFNNVLGVMGFVPGVAWPVMPQSVMADPGQMPNILPRDKFAVLSHRPQNGDPRGTSLLRPAYNGWWLKMQTWGELLKWIVQSAGSSLLGITAEHAQTVPQFDAQGNSIGSGIPPEEAMMTVLMAVQNGSVGVVPFGSDVKPFPVNHESGKAFITAIDTFDRQIANAILGQTLATEEGKGAGIGSGASTGNHADIMSQIKLYERNMLCRMVRTDILRPLVRYNFGDAAIDYVPSVSMGATDAGDFAADSTAIAALTTSGYLDASQYVAVDDLLGLPKRADDWQEQAAKRAGDMAVATAPPAPDASGKNGKEAQFTEGDVKRHWWRLWSENARRSDGRRDAA